MIADHIRKVTTVFGMETGFLEAGDGEPLVLLHGGEFGGSAELAWEQVIAPLAQKRRVIAPDILGFGRSAKTVDFADGLGWRLRHIAALLGQLDIDVADFVGNSMGGSMLLADAACANPILPARSITSICGGGEVLRNEYMAALIEYDATLDGMRAIVAALFHDPSVPTDEAYVERRYRSAMLPGAWEAVASARFRRPGHTSRASEPDYAAISIPVLLVEGGEDKLKPEGWAERLAARIGRGRFAVISGSGHCPQLESPQEFIGVIESFLDVSAPTTR